MPPTSATAWRALILALLMSFLQPVTEGPGRREGGVELITPVILLVHVSPEVDKFWVVFPAEAVFRERGFCGFAVEVRAGEVLDGL